MVFPVFAEEILLELAGADKLVYVGHAYMENSKAYTPTMELVKTKPGSNWQNCSEEELLALKPDLVILDEEMVNCYADIFPKMTQANIPFGFLSSPQSVEEIGAAILQLGQLVGEEQKANQMIEALALELDAIHALVETCSPAAPVSVAYYSGEEAFCDRDAALFEAIAERVGVSAVPSPSSAAPDKRQDVDILFFQPFDLDTDGSLLDAGDDCVLSSRNTIVSDTAVADTSAVRTQRIYPLSLYHSQHVVQSIKALFFYVYPGMPIQND